MSARRIEVEIPPVVVELDGALVYLPETKKYKRFDGATRYRVTCIVEYGGYRSRPFSLDVANKEELRQKLRVEIAKMQLAIISGYTLPFEKVG